MPNLQRHVHSKNDNNKDNDKNLNIKEKQCSCGSVVEHCVSSAKVVGSIPREHILTKKKKYSLNKSVNVKGESTLQL